MNLKRHGNFQLHLEWNAVPFEISNGIHILIFIQIHNDKRDEILNLFEKR